MSRLRDKSVLITGASSGIGAELARVLARRGAKVGLLARRDERLRELADEIRADGGTVAWAVADVTETESLERGLEATSRELGGVDVVVMNAGYGRPEPPHKFRPGSALQMYDTNLLGMLRCIDWARPGFLERGDGHLVGVASIASFLGMTNSASYCGTKAAMRVHLQGLRVSLKPYGVAVTTICPGFIESELTEKNKFPMPFLWKTERAAKKIANAIEKKRGEVVFPWQMRALIILASKLLPTVLTERLITPRKVKPYGS